jgi:enoyl-CoA hydratase/carnithine racemase
MPSARARADGIAALAPLAVAGMRRAFELLLARRAELAEPARAELEELRRLAWASEDGQEARAALAERRKPVWKGR